MKEDMASVNEPNADRYPSLNGVYTTNLFMVNKDTLQTADNDIKRWSKMILEDDYVRISVGPDSVIFYGLSADTINKKIQMEDEDSNLQYSLSYNTLPGNQFSFSGRFQSDSIFAIFTRKQKKDYLLVKRGFHLVSDYPYMR